MLSVCTNYSTRSSKSHTREVSVVNDLLSVLAGDMSGLLGDEELEHALTMPDLTLLGLQIEGRSTIYGVSRTQAGRHEERSFPPVVVTGQEDSVEDFALFSNLRAEHYFAELFPLWIPIDLLEGAESPAAIEGALGRVSASALEKSPRKDDLIIVSASMGVAELRERLDGRFSEACIGADDLLELFTATCEYYFAKEKLPAHFDRGRTSIEPPRPEELYPAGRLRCLRGRRARECTEIGMDNRVCITHAHHCSPVSKLGCRHNCRQLPEKVIL